MTLLLVPLCTGAVCAPAWSTDLGGTKFAITPDFAKQTITLAQVQKAIDEIDALAQKQIDSGAAPGLAISVVFDDKMIFAKGYGLRQVGKPEKVDADTVFQLASVSKPVGSAILARAVADKYCTWDTKIADLDPDFALAEPWVTANLSVRDLYAHRSGLADHAGDLLEDLGWDRTQVLHQLRYLEPASSMRSKYAYTNYGITEGAVAVSKKVGKSWEDLSDEWLYKPLGMESTSSRYADFAARPNKASGHMRLDGKWAHRVQRMPDGQSPAGGVSSSVNDMAKWMRMQIAQGRFEGKQIVPAEAIAETHKPQIVTGSSPINGLPEFYGLGFNVSYDRHGRLVLGHSGAFALGAGTNVKMIPAEKLGICVLVNSAPEGVAETLANIFVDTAIYGKPTQDWAALFKQIFADPATLGEFVGGFGKPPAKPVAALSNAAYVGVYDNKYFGKIKITDNGGALSATMGNGITVSLKHFDRDNFTFDMLRENIMSNNGVTFAVGGDGKAESLTIDTFNQDGQGRFERVDDKGN